MITYDFSGRSAVITGGASGIGLATARLLASSGARVALLDLDGAEAQTAAASIGPGAVGLPVDVCSSGEINGAVALAAEQHGPADILVCCAGIAGRSLPTLEVDDAEWERVNAVNANGTFYAMRAVLGAMLERGYGRIVNVASVAGKEGNPMAAAYSASKAAVIGMTKSVGKDVAGSGVLVNCIAPAPVATPMVAGLTDEHVTYMLSRVPLARLATPEEAAIAICWLASDAMTFSTGAAFDLSGGRLSY